jgi:hypothetical protein
MIPQYFLPVSTPDNRVIGTVPISLTTFDGTETSVTVGDVVYPLKRTRFETPRVLGKIIDYMAIAATVTEERAGRFKNFANYVAQQYDQIWIPLNSTVNDRMQTKGDLTKLLEGIRKSSATSTPGVSVPTPGDLAVSWYGNAPFANTPQQTFLDLTWAALLGVSSVDVPAIASVTLGDLSSHPGSTIDLRAALVYPSGNPTIPGAPVATRVRIMRLRPSGVTPGDYVWPLTLTSPTGDTVTITITLTVV